MRLHENRTLFRQAIQFTADQMKIPDNRVFLEFEEVWREMNPIHNADFKNQEYSFLPDSGSILGTLKMI